MTQKKIINMDSLEWLKNNFIKGSVIIGPPDISEIGIDYIQKYYDFLSVVADLIMTKMKDNSFLIVIMTDRYWKEDDCTKFIDKTTIFVNKAIENNFTLLFRKIISNGNQGEHLATKYLNFTNMLVFRKNSCKCMIQKDFAKTDILEPTGGRLWIKGFYGDIIEKVIVLLKINGVKHVSDFFCGVGTTLLVAEKHKMDSFGIELDKKIYEQSKTAKL
jgi:hypothetical protein